MDLLKALLGFAVLTGPLWLILILVPVSIWIAVKVAKRFRPGGIRFAGGVGVFLLVFFLPFADEIAGQMYFRYLCEVEGGPKIYKTVVVGKEYILLPGEIDTNTAGRLPARGGELNMDKLKEKFSFTTDSKKISRLFRIERDVKIIRDTQSGEMLGSDTHFLYFGGWLVNATTPHVSGKSCPTSYDAYYDQFYGTIFKQSKK